MQFVALYVFVNFTGGVRVIFAGVLSIPKAGLCDDVNFAARLSAARGSTSSELVSTVLQERDHEHKRLTHFVSAESSRFTLT